MSQKNQRASELNHSETVFSAKWTKNRLLGQVTATKQVITAFLTCKSRRTHERRNCRSD